MMDGSDKSVTEAQLQIERLKKMKESRDTRQKLEKEQAFSFPEPVPPAQPVQAQTAPAAPAQFVPAELPHAVSVKKAPAKKQQLSARIDRRNLDRIKKAVKRIKEQNRDMRLSEDMLVNMMLARVLDLGIDWGAVQGPDGLKAALSRLRTE